MNKVRSNINGSTKVVLVIGISLIISACTSPPSEGDTLPDPSESVPADAAAELGALASPTPPPSATPLEVTAIPTEVATQTPEPAQTATDEVLQVPETSPCDVAGFDSDVTIPDGTEIEANSTFTKTWRLHNDGTCTWNSDYELVFFSGEQMGGEAIHIPADTVAPGETIDISIELVAPADLGTHVGFWMLRNASGTVFGIDGSDAFYVEINVVGD
jgi:Ig-like domain from next to BRCA1 gene